MAGAARAFSRRARMLCTTVHQHKAASMVACSLATRLVCRLQMPSRFNSVRTLLGPVLERQIDKRKSTATRQSDSASPHVSSVGMVAHGLRHRPRASIKDSGTNHVRINRWLTLYKLTGWLASLDLRKPYTDVSSTTEMTTPYALLFCCRGKLLKKP